MGDVEDLERRAGSGDTEAMVALGYMAYQYAEDPESALRWFEAAANLGDERAMTWAGHASRAIAINHDLEPSYVAAHSWYSKAACSSDEATAREARDALRTLADDIRELADAECSGAVDAMAVIDAAEGATNE